jgi:hypothetical protein
MDMEISVKKIYADINGIATFVCEHCGYVKKSRPLSIRMLKDRSMLSAIVERSIRLKLNIASSIARKRDWTASYMLASSSSGVFGKIIVKNVSLGGCGFETLTANMLHPDEEIKIEFKLNDVKNTIIKEKPFIRTVKGRYIGCKFRELPARSIRIWGTTSEKHNGRRDRSEP